MTLHKTITKIIMNTNTGVIKYSQAMNKTPTGSLVPTMIFMS